MHELGIATSVADTVRGEMRRHPGARPVRVGLRIGEWAGVNPDALQFSFEVLARDTDLGQVTLEIESLPIRNRCAACDAEFRVVDYQTVCPACGAANTRTVSGHEMEIAFVELEEA